MTLRFRFGWLICWLLSSGYYHCLRLYSVECFIYIYIFIYLFIYLYVYIYVIKFVTYVTAV